MDDFFTLEEKKELFSLYRHLLQSAGDSIFWRDCQKLKKHLIKAAQCNGLQRNNFGMNPVIRDLQTAVIVAEEIGMKGSCLIGIMLHEIVKGHVLSIDEVNAEYGEDVASIIKGLVKTNELYAKSPAIESENFRNLLLSFAEDMRVILIMIADRVNVMRKIKDTGNEEDRIKVANEAAYLYAPLAHKLGLYKLKSELEDLSLKYTQKETYYFIKDKLNETKASRDKYIAAFIEPIQKKVAEAGLKFDIKGRTKSIHSIWNKIQKQKTPFEGIYDLFAIRIILDSEPDPAKEKQECWQVYSIVTDMYQPNPKRLRDWLSIPKSNGYESLHITVMGPEGKWVEVQIRTRRMDEIAERGLAAHWRYKGIKGETGLDEWLTSVREALENADNDSMKVMDQFKMDLYEDEVFVFTPKGDLFKLAKGATVLDFAFHIHSKLGCKCIGAKVNGKNVQLKQKLNSGDQVEIMTSNTQTPKQDWLNIVTTSKARTKIRQALKEMVARQHAFAKETLERKFKNRKLEYDEATRDRRHTAKASPCSGADAGEGPRYFRGPWADVCQIRTNSVHAFGHSAQRILCRARDAAHGRDAHAADRGGGHPHAGLRPPVAGGLFGHRHPAARLGLHRAGARRDAHGRPARGRKGAAPGSVRHHEPRRAPAQACRRAAQVHTACERTGFSRRARRDLAHRTGGARLHDRGEQHRRVQASQRRRGLRRLPGHVPEVVHEKRARHGVHRRPPDRRYRRIQSRPAYSHQRGLYRRSGARQARHSQLQSPRCEKQG